MQLRQLFTGSRCRRPPLGYGVRDDSLWAGYPGVKSASRPESSTFPRSQNARSGGLGALELLDDLPPCLVPAKYGDSQAGGEFVLVSDGLDNLTILSWRPYISTVISFEFV